MLGIPSYHVGSTFTAPLLPQLQFAAQRLRGALQRNARSSATVKGRLWESPETGSAPCLWG